MELKKIIYYLLLSLFITISGCEPNENGKHALNIKNNSNDRIYYWYSGDYSSYHYPDTILPVEEPLDIFSVSANNIGLASGIDPNWTEIYSQLPEGKFSVYFISNTTIENFEWNEIQENNMISQRIDTDFETMKNSGYLITYDE